MARKKQIAIQDGPHRVFVNIPDSLTPGSNPVVLQANEAGEASFSEAQIAGVTAQEYIDTAVATLPGGHDAVSLAGLDYIIKDAAQGLTLGQIDLATDVTGALPGANLDAATQASLVAADTAIQPGDIDTLAGLNTIVGDTTIADTTYVDTAIASIIIGESGVNANITTVDSAVTEMYQLVLPNDTTWFFTINIAARRTDGDNESAAYRFEGALDRNATPADTSFVGLIAKTTFAEDIVNWDTTVSIDQTTGALVIKVTGEDGKTILWNAKIDITESTG